MFSLEMIIILFFGVIKNLYFKMNLKGTRIMFPVFVQFPSRGNDPRADPCLVYPKIQKIQTPFQGCQV